MNIYINLSEYIAEWLLKLEFFRRYRKNQNTDYIFNNVFRKPSRLWDKMENFTRIEEATDDNILLRRRDAICWPDN
jgi:hypothetical protein